jgi:hypothetical protein
MSKLIGRFLEDATVAPAHLTSAVAPAILDTRLHAYRNTILAFSAGGLDDTVTSPVLAAAFTGTPQTTFTAKGIYTGAAINSAAPGRVNIRAAGTPDGIPDGNDAEVFGKLTEAAGVYTLTYYKQDGTGFVMPAATSIDFSFVEIYSEKDAPVAATLLDGIGQVVDATDANAILAAKAQADLAITRIGTLDPTPTNYTPDTDAAVVADHLKGIDTAIGALTAAGVAAVEYFTLSGGDITNEYVTLAFTPTTAANVELSVRGQGEQFYGDDYTMVTSVRVGWTALALATQLSAGDKLRVRYNHS